MAGIAIISFMLVVLGLPIAFAFLAEKYYGAAAFVFILTIMAIPMAYFAATKTQEDEKKAFMHDCVEFHSLSECEFQYKWNKR